MRLSMSLILAAGLTACDLSGPGPGGLPDGVGEELTTFSGCGDIHLFAHDDDDTLGLLVTLPEGLIDEARDSGGPASFSFGLPAPALPTVQLLEGVNVTTVECNDAISADQMPEIDRTWVAASGTVQGEVTATGDDPQPWDNPGMATVELVDVVLESDGQSVELGPVTFTDISVGWLPG